MERRGTRIGGLRLLAVILLAVAGTGSIAAGFAGLSLVAYRGLGLLREAGTTEQTQRFAFDRVAWRAIVVDDLFHHFVMFGGMIYVVVFGPGSWRLGRPKS